MRSPSFCVTAYCQTVSEPFAAIALAMPPASPPSSLSSASFRPITISSFTVMTLNRVSAAADAANAIVAAATSAAAVNRLAVMWIAVMSWPPQCETIGMGRVRRPQGSNRSNRPYLAGLADPAVERRAIPSPQIGRRRVAASQEIHQRAVGIGGGAHGVIGQQKLAHLLSIERPGRAYFGGGETLRRRIGVGVERVVVERPP